MLYCMTCCFDDYKGLLVYNVLVILRGYSPKKTLFKRNLGSQVKNCPKVSLIYLSESVRRGLILIGCDIYWGLVWEAQDHMQITCRYCTHDHMQMQMQTE